MRLAGYVRVSTDRQAEEGSSLEDQRRDILAWADEKGHTVALWCADEGLSGSNGIETRDGLAEALEAIEDGRAEGLVVYCLDRLARDLIVQEQLLAELRRVGASIFSTKAGEDAYLTDDPSDPSRALIRRILGAVAAYERDMIRLRMRRGKIAKRARTGKAAEGPAPYGWAWVGRELVPDPTEATRAALMGSWRDSGLSLTAIAERANAEGWGTKRGARWSAVQVARALEHAECAAPNISTTSATSG